MHFLSVRPACHLLGAVTVLAVGLTALLALLAPAAPARTAPFPSTDTSGTCEAPERDDSDPSIYVVGCLRDSREQPPVPAPGVGVTLSDAEGNELDTTKSDENGAFTVVIPGDPVSALGQEYVVALDVQTLPDGFRLRDPDSVEQTITVNTDADQTVAFPVVGPPSETSAPPSQDDGPGALTLVLAGLALVGLGALLASGFLVALRLARRPRHPGS